MRAGFITFGHIISFALLGLYSNKACRPIQKSSSPPPSCLGKERFLIEKTLTTFKCPCSTWTVDFQHLKNLHALIEYFRFKICFSWTLFSVWGFRAWGTRIIPCLGPAFPMANHVDLFKIKVNMTPSKVCDTCTG